MDGILILDKPEGFTSFDLVAKVRGMLHTRKVGHAGTLDPMATGVLPIFVGKATRCCDLLPDSDKQYRAQFQLGWTTDTLDRTGTVRERFAVSCGRQEVEAVLERFRGDIQQLPPMYSAIQIGGKRLYDLARQGVEVERQPRPVTIRQLELTGAWEDTHTYEILVICSKGTYIRTLCDDIGAALGCGAVMTSLRRTRAAGFGLEEALSLEEAQRLCDCGELASRLLPLERVFASLPALTLRGKQETMYRNGVRLDARRLPWGPDFPDPWEGELRVLGEDGAFLGLAQVREGQLVTRKFFGQPTAQEEGLRG